MHRQLKESREKQMRFAIISDIHGNLPALDAALEDARNNHVDEYIFVGDYCLGNPYPDECIQRIHDLEKAHIIQGNDEKYLENLMGKDQSTWIDGQMQISYYAYRAIHPERLQYLLSMPHTLYFGCHGVDVHVAHSSKAFIADCEHSRWSSSKVARKYREQQVTSASFRVALHHDLDKDDRFQQVMAQLPCGVYIFGHSHIQWSYQSKDGKTVLINPGSCGLPLDGITGSIPYAILDISDAGKMTVEEKRVPFDMESYIDVFTKSDQFAKANVWSKVMIPELRTAREHISFFLRFVEEYAEKIGDKRRPFMLDTWEAAYELWEKQ